MSANDDLHDYLGQLHRNNLEPSFGSYMEPAAGWVHKFNSVVSTVGTIAIPNPKDASLVVGPTKTPHNSRNAVVGVDIKVNGSDNTALGDTQTINGNNNIVIGSKLIVVGDDQVIIGKFNLNAMQERITKLEEMVKQIWRTPGGHMRREAEERSDETTVNLSSR